jgi:hypothetical protein
MFEKANQQEAPPASDSARLQRQRHASRDAGKRAEGLRLLRSLLRPRVSNVNLYYESLLRTPKYRPD